MKRVKSDRRLVPSIFGLAGSAVSVGGLRPGLAAMGLHIVTAEDKAVLDAMAAMPRLALDSWLDEECGKSALAAACRAELARREAGQ